ncbi:conjugal transfer protein TrbL [Myceligenerans pegani]|uniref:Conjugal transfer protein TrbL n=1 Tax=Myceligenerans pegani TaxID=2776917 RepID=A0ABR9N5P5_9MICO|nr:conjugal transfer protein TrbL [Myceligenerans sp. TRM 65318]MBE1878975.1 conjugal transfer protein TrbL [Myceligenerans sp. TRM 65318]MBE3021246.1 conjugal transfer protein TrbL [Myceligenerans sp. TRM 65318]
MAALDDLTGLIGQAASMMMQGLWQGFEATTFVDVTTPAFRDLYGVVFGVAVFVMVTFFLLQLITAMLRREPAGLARAGLGLAKSILGSFVVVTITAGLLEITDRVCLAIVAASGRSLEQMGTELGLIITGTAVATRGPGGPILTLFLAGLALSATFLMWLTLLVRKALLLIAIALAPLALAGATWDGARGWVARWAQFVLALILSKLVIVVILLLAVSLVTAPTDGDLAPWADKLAGIVLLLMSAFAPYLAFKAISFVGFDPHTTASMEAESKQALDRSVPTLSAGGAAGTFLGSRGASVLGPNGRPTTATGSPGAGAGGGAGATSSGAAGAGTGAGASAGGGAAAGAGAAAGGPAAVAVAGAQVAKKSATAGPQAGAGVGQAAGQQADAVSGSSGSASGSSVAAGSAARTQPAATPATPLAAGAGGRPGGSGQAATAAPTTGAREAGAGGVAGPVTADPVKARPVVLDGKGRERK